MSFTLSCSTRPAPDLYGREARTVIEDTATAVLAPETHLRGLASLTETYLWGLASLTETYLWGSGFFC